MQKVSAVLVCTLISAGIVQAQTLQEIGGRMEAMTCYADSARYEVFLPNLSEPVVYTLELESMATPADSVAPCSYFIGWQLPAPSGVSDGFLAYFDGTHYRMRDSRLQEYHQEETPEVFAPGGNISRGVQMQAQFVDLLPQTVGRRFTEMAADTTYKYTIENGRYVAGKQCIVVKGVRRFAGFDAAEYTYALDAATLRPVQYEFENNPGQLGEQSITVNFAYSSAVPACRIDEESVVARRPEDFGKFRESTFSLEKLPGGPMPRIAARTTTGERYEHERGSAFAAPTIVVFVDAEVGTTGQLVEDVRGAVDMLPQQTDVVWAFLNHRVEDVEAIVPRLRPGEHLLVNARGAARECGVGSITPVILFASPTGTVTNYIVGYNNDMPSVVIQYATEANN